MATLAAAAAIQIRSSFIHPSRSPSRRCRERAGLGKRRNESAVRLCRRCAVSQDRLGLEELAEGRLAPFAAVARALVAAEGGVEVDAGAVQRHLAGAQARGGLAHPGGVL